MSLSVRPIASGADLAAAKDLCRAFRDVFATTNSADPDVVEAYYSEETFEDLLARLPEIHAPPRGGILLATHHDEPVGCAMLAPLAGDRCELKRMFVTANARGLGAGRALLAAAKRYAADAGYTIMQLDTGPRQTEAIALYERDGFRRIPAPDSLPQRMRDWLIFMETRLDPQPESSS